MFRKALLPLAIVLNVVFVASSQPAPVTQINDQELVSRQVVGSSPIHSLEDSYMEEGMILDAYVDLASQVMTALDQPSEQDFLPETSWRMLIKSGDDWGDLLPWLLASDVNATGIGQEDAIRELVVTSPPMHEIFDGRVRHMAEAPVDWNEDGKMDRLIWGYDGKLYLQVWDDSSESWQTKASSHSEQFLQWSSVSSSKSVAPSRWCLLHRVEAVGRGGIKVVSGKGVRVLVDYLTLETLEGRVIARTQSSQEVFIPTDGSTSVVTIDKSRSALVWDQPTLPFKGEANSSWDLDRFSLSLNNKRLVRKHLKGEKKTLDWDLQLPLRPGYNWIDLALTDTKRGYAKNKTGVFYQANYRRDAGSTQALLLGQERYGKIELEHVNEDLENVFKTLTKYTRAQEEQVKMLRGESLTKQGALEALQGLVARSKKGGVTWLYFVGRSKVVSGEGKVLCLSEDQTLSAEELLDALEGISGEVVVVLDSARDAKEKDFSLGRRWLYTKNFADSLAEKGWTVLASTDPLVEQRCLPHIKGGILTTYLCYGLAGPADLNRDGSVHSGELYRYVVYETHKAYSSLEYPVEMPLLRNFWGSGLEFLRGAY